MSACLSFCLFLSLPFSPYVCPSLTVYLSASICLCVCVSLSSFLSICTTDEGSRICCSCCSSKTHFVCLPYSKSVCFPLSDCLFICFYLSVCVSLSLSSFLLSAKQTKVSVFVAVVVVRRHILSVSLTVSPYVSLSLTVYLSASICLCVCLSLFFSSICKTDESFRICCSCCSSKTHFVCLPYSKSVCFPLSDCLFICFYLCVCVCVSLSLLFSLSAKQTKVPVFVAVVVVRKHILSVSLTVSPYVSLSLTVYLSASICLCVSLSLFFSSICKTDESFRICCSCCSSETHFVCLPYSKSVCFPLSDCLFICFYLSVCVSLSLLFFYLQNRRKFPYLLQLL